MDRKLLPLYQSLVDHPKKWIAAWLLIMAGLTAALYVDTQGFTEVEYHNGPYLYFTEDHKEFKLLRHLENTYAPDNSLMFVYAPDNGDVFTRDSLALIERLTEAAWTLPYVMRVDSISNFQHTKVEGDDLLTDYLYDEAQNLTETEIQQVKQIALNEKSLVRQSISETGNVAAVIATVNLDEAQSRAREIMPPAQALVAELEQEFGTGQILLLGDVAFANASHIASQESFTRTTPIAMTLVLVCLIVLLRNAYSVIATQLMITFSIVFAYGIFILGDFMLSPISAGASPIILTLAVADCVHILVTYQQQCGQGKDKRAAMLESLRLNFSPVWLTSITTAIGFLMMNFAEAPPFHDLGNAVFLGVMMAFLFSVFLLPPIMMLVPKPQYRFGDSQQRAMQALGNFTIRFRKPLLAGMSVMMVVLIAFIPNNRINDILTEYFDETFAARRALDMYLENVGGIQRLAFAVPAKDEGGITDPSYLKHLDEFVTWVEQNPDVSHVRNFVDVVKRLNRNMHGGDERYYRVPEQRDLVAQYLLLYELGLPFGLGLDTQINMDKSETKMEVVFNRIPSETLIQHRENIHDWMQANWPEYMQSWATGMDSLFSDITFANVKAMVVGTTLALVLVSALLIITLRSFRYGLLSLLPNLLPAAITFGLWGMMVGEVGLVISIITCMTLGIIIDDTVHFLSKYVRAKREQGLDAEGASRYAFQTVGVALIATSVILVANFAVMGMSHYYPNAATGILTSMTITAALVIHFFFFVPLLLTLDRKRQRPATIVTEKTVSNLSKAA